MSHIFVRLLIDGNLYPVLHSQRSLDMIESSKGGIDFMYEIGAIASFYEELLV